MKKLSAVAVAVCCLCVGSAFATWDKFAPRESGGEAKLEFAYEMPQEKLSGMGIRLGARYTIIPGLEAALKLPIPLSLSYDGESEEGFAGLSYPEIDVRYWLTDLGLGFFLDFALPVDTRYDKDEKPWYEPAMSIAIGAQYSRNFTEELSLGSQIGILIPFERSESKYKEGMDLLFGVELDYAIGAIVPYLGLDLVYGLTAATYDGEDFDADPLGAGIDLTIGATYHINEAMDAGLSIGLGFGEDRVGLNADGDANLPVSIGLSFGYKF